MIATVFPFCVLEIGERTVRHCSLYQCLSCSISCTLISYSILQSLQSRASICASNPKGNGNVAW